MKTLLKSLPAMALAFALHPPVLAAQDMDMVKQHVYEGLCDASAAIAIGDSHFLVGEDEGKKGECLHLYRKGESKSVKQFCQFTKRLRGHPEHEIDIEGAARMGNRIYWITSHGRNGKGKLIWNRHRLFALDMVDGLENPEDLELEWVGSYDDLVPDMVKADTWIKPDAPDTKKIIGLLEKATKIEDAKACSLAPKKKGLNIEGLAVSPDGKGLLVGLRNPLDKEGRAIVLHITNPKALVTEPNASARFGTPFYLDLDGLGVRSMAQVPGKQAPDKKEYLIVAGPPGAESEPFKLFRWGGAEDDLMLIGKLDGAKGSGPEALVVYEGGSRIQVLHDEGSRKPTGDAKKCKKEKRKNRRFSDRWYEVE